MTKVVDFFDHVGALPNDRVATLSVAPSENHPPSLPKFYAGPFPDELRHYLGNRPASPSLDIFILRGVLIGPDGMVCSDGHALSSWRFNQPREHIATLLSKAQTVSNCVKKVSGTVVLMAGPGWRVYGHWLVDMLPRLHLLKKAGFDTPKLRFLIPSHAPAFVFSLLEYFGITTAQIITWDQDRELVSPEELVVVTNLREQDRFHSEMLAARNTLLSMTAEAADCRDPVSIYVARTHSARSIQNRSEIEAAALSRGYTIVRPETLSVGQQVQLFGRAQRIVGEYGSGLHGSMFAPSSTPVLAIRGTSRYPGLIQSALCETLHQPIGYIFGESPFDALDQPFSIEIGNFHAGLDWLGQ